MANERAALIEREHQWKQESQFDRLLAQQRRALQVEFDQQTESFRTEIEESQRTARQQEEEIRWLRSQVEQMRN